MSEQRLGPNAHRAHQFDPRSNNPVDLFLRSESPRVQHILLYQQLKEEIEKNPSTKVRYIDSELYLRNQERSSASGPSEAQTSNLSNEGGTIASGSAGYSKTHPSHLLAGSSKKESLNLKADQALDVDHLHENQTDQMIDKNCQVCIIKEARQELMNITKMVQERNEEISKLKAKCLRTYFERQVMD